MYIGAPKKKQHTARMNPCKKNDTGGNLPKQIEVDDLFARSKSAINSGSPILRQETKDLVSD